MIILFCCFSASGIVTGAFVYAGVTHELSTFPLRHPFDFPPSVCPLVILILSKTINLVDFELEHFTSYGEFINCNTQRYML